MKYISIILFSIMFLCLGLFSCTNGLGKSISLDSKKDLFELQRLVYMAFPAINELSISYKKNGEYPASLEGTSLTDIYISNVFSYNDSINLPYFHYLPSEDKQSFVIYLKINMEATLWYRSESKKWTFSQEVIEEEFEL